MVASREMGSWLPQRRRWTVKILDSGLSFVPLPLIIKVVLRTTQYVVTNERIVVCAFKHSSTYRYKDLWYVDIKPQTKKLCDLVFFSQENEVDDATSAPSVASNSCLYHKNLRNT